jgi:hypothetical protein
LSFTRKAVAQEITEKQRIRIEIISGDGKQVSIDTSFIARDFNKEEFFSFVEEEYDIDLPELNEERTMVWVTTDDQDAEKKIVKTEDQEMVIIKKIKADGDQKEIELTVETTSDEKDIRTDSVAVVKKVMVVTEDGKTFTIKTDDDDEHLIIIKEDDEGGKGGKETETKVKYYYSVKESDDEPVKIIKEDGNTIIIIKECEEGKKEKEDKEK